MRSLSDAFTSKAETPNGRLFDIFFNVKYGTNPESAVKKVLAEGAAINSMHYKRSAFFGGVGYTPLMYAALTGRQVLVKPLLEFGANLPVRLYSKWVDSIQDEQCDREATKAAIFDLDTNTPAFINIYLLQAKEGLYLYFRNKNSSYVTLKINPDKLIGSALHNYINTLENKQFNTEPAHIEADELGRNIVNKLIYKALAEGNYRADVYRKTKDGHMAHHLAVMHGQTDTFDLLIQKFPELIYVGLEGLSLIDLAKRHHQDDMAWYLAVNYSNPMFPALAKNIPGCSVETSLSDDEVSAEEFDVVIDELEDPREERKYSAITENIPKYIVQYCGVSDWYNLAQLNKAWNRLMTNDEMLMERREHVLEYFPKGLQDANWETRLAGYFRFEHQRLFVLNTLSEESCKDSFIRNLRTVYFAGDPIDPDEEGDYKFKQSREGKMEDGAALPVYRDADVAHHNHFNLSTPIFKAYLKRQAALRALKKVTTKDRAVFEVDSDDIEKVDGCRVLTFQSVSL